MFNWINTAAKQERYQEFIQQAEQESLIKVAQSNRKKISHETKQTVIFLSAQYLRNTFQTKRMIPYV